MNVLTLLDLYRTALIDRPKPDAFRVKREGAYRDVSSQEFLEAGAELAAGLRALGLAPGDRVGLIAETRWEWGVADFGILLAGLVSVPVYPSLTAPSVEHVLRDSGARALIAADSEQAAKAAGLRGAEGGFPVIVMDGDPAGPNDHGWAALRARGRQAGALSLLDARARPEDLATIIYTSGTTGVPKGVMLSHGNLAGNASSALLVLPLLREDTCLSFLPLSHVFERTGGLYCMLLAGATIAYAESLEKVVENLQETRPTVLLAVPRFYEKIYKRVLESVVEGGPGRRRIFQWARSAGQARSRALLAGRSPGFTQTIAYALADRLVWSKIRARVGGRLRFFVSGGAPLAPEIAEFFHAAGIPILEGYGLTETSPIVSINTLETIRLGTVGRPIQGVGVRIAADGEILVQGPNVMQGYYHLPEATAEVLKDGWFHTGDIGHLDEAGSLVITDRKKDLIVTAGGKNVAPQPLENRLKTDRYITEALVVGDNRPYLVALLVPNFRNLELYARDKGIDFTGPADLVRNPRIQAFLKERVDLHQKEAAPFETIKRVHVLDREFEGSEMTQSLKVKRKVVTQNFAREIAALYGG